MGDLFVNGGKSTPTCFSTPVDTDQMHNPHLALNAVDGDRQVGMAHRRR